MFEFLQVCLPIVCMEWACNRAAVTLQSREVHYLCLQNERCQLQAVCTMSSACQPGLRSMQAYKALLLYVTPLFCNMAVASCQQPLVLQAEEAGDEGEG